MLLGDHLNTFIDAQVRSGRYGSASYDVRAGFRMLEQHESKVNPLWSAVLRGEQSVESRPFDFEGSKACKWLEFGRAGVLNRATHLPAHVVVRIRAVRDSSA